MTDPIPSKIQAETSEACLRALRSWAIEEGRWHEHVHQGPYAEQIVKIKRRWKQQRGE